MTDLPPRAIAMLSLEGSQLTHLRLRKDFAQTWHARPMPQPKSSTVSTSPTSCWASSICSGRAAAVAVEEIRLRGEDRLVLSGTLIEIDAFHGAVSCER